MKAFRWSIVVLFALAFSLPAFTQETEEASSGTGEKWSSYYYINIPIEKIYPHRMGYMVVYRKSGMELGRAYLPVDWFIKAGGKGDLIKMDSGSDWPYMSVFYDEGQFSHIKLFVQRNMNHQTWGHIPNGSQLDDRFAVEDLTLEF